MGLAYIGDGIFELMVRERILAQGNCPVSELHRRTVACVCANAQSEAFGQLEELLSPEELAVYKRGRNAGGNHVPRSTAPVIYRRATGFEALFGYLYLSGQTKRLEDLFQVAFDYLMAGEKDSEVG